jgi:hypothetical protein
MTSLMRDSSSPGAANATSPPANGLAGVMGKVFSFQKFLILAVSAGGLLVTVWENAPVIAGRLFVEGDTWWHTAVGERILSAHTWPTVDVYSFTVPGSAWIAYEWLGEVVMAIAARLGGIAGLAVLLGLLAMTIALLTYWYAWLRCGNTSAAALATVVALQITPSSFTMRPQLIGYAFLLITLIALERFRQHRTKSLWFLPALFLVWVNTHSSFVLGFVALGAYWAGGLVAFRWGALAADRWTAGERKHLLWVTLLSLAAIFVTPYGTRLAEYPLEVMLRQRSTLLLASEWLPLNFGPPYAKVFLFLVIGALILHLVAPATIRLDVLLLFLFTLVESCLHVRFLLFFVIIFAPMLASLLSHWLPPVRAARGRPLLNGLMIVVLAAATLVLIPSRSKLEQIRARVYPVGAVKFLRQHAVPERMFNDDNWGGYLIRALPERRVFMDGRFDIYEYGGVLLDYYNFVNRRDDPGKLLKKYRLDSVLLRTGGALQSYFAASQDWRKVYQDSTSVIYVRDGADSGAPAP